VSELGDPRVLFAAERTLLAWSRTATGLMAFGFLVDRAGLLVQGAGAARDLGFWIGLAFILLGVALSLIAVLHYARAVQTLQPAEIPRGYWVHLSTATSVAIALLGLALAVYLIVT